MIVQSRVLPSTYYDSVFLMGIAGRLAKVLGISRTAALMATPKNKALLEEFGVNPIEIEAAGPMDLVLAVLTASPEQAAEALAQVDGWLHAESTRAPGTGAASLEGALQVLPDANLAVISVPGEYAAYEARRSLERGLHVFLFSDNVSLEEEVALKRQAAECGLLVMGPDCGTTLISGAGIGFANVVRRGPIGVVGPSGTGIQQVTSLIHQLGSGVSNALGTGSRDLSDAVGGITTFAALEALAEDELTQVIAIISKPPGAETKQRVLDWIASSNKPVVTCFLGETGDGAPVCSAHHPVRTLADAAACTLRLVGGAVSVAWSADHDGPRAAQAHAMGFVRGLFAGGTFCYEAQQIFLAAGMEVRSNAPLRKELRLADPLRSVGHAMVDLGDDEFTLGRPHPMIDATLRNERILVEAADPEVTILLLDFILGYGAAADPAGDALPVIEAARRLATQAGRTLTIVASVCGTDQDPQVWSRQVAALQDAGVIVAASSSQAAAFALSAALPTDGTTAGKET